MPTVPPLPPDNRATGTGSPAADIDEVVDAIGQAVFGETGPDNTIVVGGTENFPTIERAAITGDVSIPANSNTATLATTGPGATGPIGSATVTPVVTIDAKGRVTGLTSVTITGGSSGEYPNSSGAAMTVPRPMWVDVRDYGADMTGSSSADTDVAAALTALSASSYNTGGGVLFIPPGSLKKSTTTPWTINNPAVSIKGCGSAATHIVPTSAVTSCDVFRIQCETGGTYIGTQAGSFEGFTIDGTSAGASAVGWHYGDTLAGLMSDMIVKNFTGTGSIGVRMHNAVWWTERTKAIRLRLWNNKTGISFESGSPGTSSFGYTNIMDMNMDVNAGQVGLLMTTGSQIYNGYINIAGNFSGTGAAFLSFQTGVANAWNNIECQIRAEGNSGAGILVGASDNFQSCHGSMDFGAVSGNTSVDSNGYSNFTGHWRVPGFNITLGDSNFFNGHGAVQPGTGFAFGAHLWSGSGNPGTASTGPMAYTAATAGDAFFRTDTPTTANQRLYICTTSGTPGTWSGIL